MGWTNKGKAQILNSYFRDTETPGTFYVALCTEATSPDADTDDMGDVTEINAGSGYVSGGYALDRNSTDFDTLIEDDTNDRAYIRAKDVTWTASGGPIPCDGGDGARWAVLTNDHTTVASREVYAFWDLTSPRQVSDGQDLSLQNLELRILES